MGMFDYVACDAPLPVPTTGDWLQSKDGPCELGTVRITADGRLKMEEWHWEEVPEEQRPYYGKPEWDDDGHFGKDFYRLCGSSRRVIDNLIDQDFHGDFEFYDSATRYIARFTHGQLEEITAKPW